MDDYTFRFTGDPFLDGAIWARGALKTLSTAEIAASSMPEALTEDLRSRAEALGFETDYKEFQRVGMGEPDLRLVLAKAEPVFRDLTLRFRERRLVAGLPREFLAGYFAACAGVPRLRFLDLRPGTVPLALKVLHEPVDDVLAALADLGVTSATPTQDRVVLDPEDFDQVPELEAIRDTIVAEEQQMRSAHGGTLPELAVEAALANSPGRTLTGLAEDLMERIELLKKLIADEEARSRKGQFLTMSIQRSPVHNRVFQDYCFVTGQKPSETVTCTALGLQTLEVRYERILVEHFLHSQEFSMAVTMALDLLGRVAAGASPTTGQDSPASFWDVRGPTHEAIAAFLVQAVFPQWFAVLPEGIFLTLLPKDVKEFPKDTVEERVKAKAATAMDFLRGFSFEDPNGGLAAQMLEKCTSCDSVLVLASGHECEDCGVSLCKSCFVMYGRRPDNPSPFAADPRAGYCATHAHAVIPRGGHGPLPKHLGGTKGRGGRWPPRKK